MKFADYWVHRSEYCMEGLSAVTAASVALGQWLELVQITDLSGTVELGEVAPAERKLPG
jgi:hypothetical protein